MVQPIEIVDYDPTWPQTFERLRDQLAMELGAFAGAIEHVGSTAVPGLSAKPIIDIDIVIDHPDQLPDVISRLGRLGYEHQGDLGIAGRDAFNAPDSLPAHHLYVVVTGSKPHRDHTDLRDHLRASKQDALRYAEVKRALALRFRNDRQAYTEAKSDIIQELLMAVRSET